jgi:hypothetical protein
MEICGIKIKSKFYSNEFDEITNSLKSKYNIIGFIDGNLFSNTLHLFSFKTPILTA